MTSHQTSQEPPIVLSDPTRPPRPFPSCGVCKALDQQRAQAEEDKDIRRATMFEMEIRRHPRHRDEATA